MASRDELLAHAHDLLDLDSFPDYGPMGMQVTGSPDVTRIACGVSASRELFEQAAAVGAELLIVHHGLFWDNEPRVVDRRMRGRLEALFAGDITLAAYHLALDAHPELGNNALLAAELGVQVDRPFQRLGVGGRLAEAVALDVFVARIRERLGSEPIVFPCGRASVDRVAIVTGGAARYVTDAAAEGYDVYVTGEAAEPTLATAKELGVHFVAAGHHATERLGVQALAARLADRFGVDWQFIDVPNPV
jgi:dinuclear metal center YbgI/SA1388 family protein